MPLTIGSNIESLKAIRQLNRTTDRLSSIYERLSSGQRINHASDDAAGLAVASGLNAKARIYTQALRNINDSVSALQIGSSALDSLTQITIRQKELATEAAQGTLKTSQRTALDKEAQALAQEYNRIIYTTQFNNQQLLFAPNTVSAQAGIGAAESIQALIGAGLATSTTSSSGSGSTSINGGTDESWIFDNFTLGEEADTLAFGSPGSISNGDYFTFSTATQTYDVWFNVDGAGGGDPGSGYGIEVDISSFDGANLIGSATASAIMAHLPPVDSANVTATFVGNTESSGYGYGGSILLDIKAPAAGVVVQTGNIDVNTVAGGFTTAATITADAYGNGSYLHIASPIQNYYVWYTIDGNGSDPGLGYGIEVDLLSSDNESTIRSKTSTAVTAAGFTVTSGTYNGHGSLTITANNWGAPLGAWSAYGGLDATSVASGANPTNINLVTDRFTATNHGFSTGDAVTVSTTGGGTLPGGLSASTTYYIIKIDNNTFKLATSAANAQSGTAINITDFGSVYTSLNVSSTSSSSTTTNYAESFSLLTQSSARTALDTLDRQFQRISTEQSTVGAFMSRLSVAYNATRSRRDQYIAAASRITDTDVAADSANLIRTQILQQAAAAVLAQANQEPALALKLLF